MNAVDQLTDIERHDYCHTDPTGEGDLITVRVTVDLVISREDWDEYHGTGTDPIMIRDSVQQEVRRAMATPPGFDPEDLRERFRTVTLRRGSGAEIAKRYDRGRRR